MLRILYSLINGTIGVFFILLGAVGVFLPWSNDVRTSIVQFVTEDSYVLFLFGLGLILVGFAFLFYLVVNAGRSFYSIKVGNQIVTVNEAIVLHYLASYWHRIFPNIPVMSRIIIKQNSIRVRADLPYVPESEQEPLLSRIQDDLGEIFGRVLGYPHELVIEITFLPAPASRI